MAVPAPPAALSPRLTTWPKNGLFFRVHRLEFRRRSSTQAVPAIAETVFRDIRSGGVMMRSRLAGLGFAEVRPRRDLQLVELYGYGLKRLNLHPHELTSTNPAEYSSTIAWAKALYAATDADGLVWMSHQFNTQRALMLFGDRVKADDLDGGVPMPLTFGAGLDAVERSANEAAIVIV